MSEKSEDFDFDETATPENLEDCFKILSTEARQLYLRETVPVLDSPPTPLQFYRDYVSWNRPVLIRNGLDHWEAIKHWQENAFFRNHFCDKKVTVAVTPNGYADSPLDDRFVMPEERSMKFGDFLDIMETPELDPSGIYYIQKQNSNLTQEFSELLKQVPELDWAREAFAQPPDAVNFWMGDSRAVTSMHKDPYENIYCVVRGYKDIILHPPTDLPWIPYRDYKPAVFKFSDNGFLVEDCDGPDVPWVSVDPTKPDLDKYPQYANTTQIKVRVRAGEILYLPSLWFHHLKQSHGCVSINFWYDMAFDVKYNYSNFLNNVSQISKKL